MLLQKRRSFLLPILISFLFQLVFTSVVATINPDSLAMYCSLAFIGFLCSSCLFVYIYKCGGNIESAFIFGQLVSFGIAIQSCLTQPTLSTFLMYSVAFVAAGAVLVFYEKIVNFLFDESSKKGTVIVVIATVLLVAIMILEGTGVDETRSWIYVGNISIQVTEILKVIYAYFLTLCVKKQGFNRLIIDNRSILKLFLFLGIFSVIFAYSNEFGTVLVIGLVSFITLFLLQENRRVFRLISVLGIISIAVILGFVYFVVKNDVELNNHMLIKIVSRLGTFISYESMSFDETLQVGLSQKAIKVGGFFGSCSNYDDLINSSTDTIFPYICLKLGLIGGCLTVASYIIFFIKIQKAISSRKSSLFVVCTLLNLILLTQAVINIACSINLLPLSGIGLNFLSAGGSWLVLSVTISVFLIRVTCQHNLPPKIKYNNPVVVDKFFSNEEEVQENE